MKPKVLILDAPGINCDEETYYAVEKAGGAPEYVMLSDIENKPDLIFNYRMLILPGGFSYGDYISAGKVVALIIRNRLREHITEFIERGNLILGICNGFQIMVKSGLLPGPPYFETPRVSLVENDSGRFEDRWVYLDVNTNSRCVYTMGIERMYLPVAHGEGKFVTDETTLLYLEDRDMVVFRYSGPNNETGYPFNPNGSMGDIAGICDETGRVMGMMPHPERYTLKEHHPFWTRGDVFCPTGLKIFENAVNFIVNNL